LMKSKNAALASHSLEMKRSSSMNSCRRLAIGKAIHKGRQKEEKKRKEDEEEFKKNMEVVAAVVKEVEEMIHALPLDKLLEALESKLEELRTKKHKLFLLLKQILNEDEKKKKEEEEKKKK